MKRLTQLTVGCLSVVLTLCLLAACAQQQGPVPETEAFSGLVPDQASTGDPPLIPHDVDPSDGGEECLGCHKEGEMGATKIPDWHATLTDCRQCHVIQGEQVGEFKPEY